MNAEKLAKTLTEIGSDLERINDPLEPLKVASALKSEILKYEYRKAHNPKEIGPLDYTVMAALMLQIPTEPKAKADLYPSGQYDCPSCGCAVTEVHGRKNGAFGEIPYIVQLNRCYNCGQVIAWEEDDEE